MCFIINGNNGKLQYKENNLKVNNVKNLNLHINCLKF